MPDSKLRLTLGKQVCIILLEERLRTVRKSSMNDEQKEEFDKLASRIKTLGSKTADIEKVEQLINILNSELESIGEASSGGISYGTLLPQYMEYINPKNVSAM